MSNADTALHHEVAAELDGWPVTVHIDIAPARLGAALERLQALGYRPRQQPAAAPSAPALRPAPNLGGPTCPIHGTAKIREGKRGGHYCAAQLADGSYCRERPQ